MAGMVGRCLDGFNLSDAAFGMDVIREGRHFPGSYLDTDHTINWWRSERYLPRISSRESYEKWTEMGGKELYLRADEKARDLLDKHQVVPLSPEVNGEINNLLKAAAKEKGVA